MIHFEYVNDTGKRIADIIRKENLPFEGEAIVFVGAMGICVRKILPLVNDKYADPAVICIDSTGKYIIPVLSGHVGGANSLARSIASVLGGEAIITTQSDNMGLWPLDTLAADFHWAAAPIPRQEMNVCIAAFVNKQPTALVIECDDAGAQHLKQTLPPHVSLFDSCEAFASLPASQKSAFNLLIVVSPFERSNMLQPSEPCKHQLRFYPRCLHLGVGCQKMAPETVADIVLKEVARMGYAIQSIATIETIDLKKDEPCLARLSSLLPEAQLRIHTSGALAKVEMPNPSSKVFDVTGCYGVAEASALSASGRALLIEKHKGCAEVAEGDGGASHYTFALSVDRDALAANRPVIAADGSTHSLGHIEIVGAGPGDPDLVSVRGRKFLERADLILYAGSLVPRQLTLCAKQGCVVRSSANMDLEEQFALMKQHYDRGHLVVRLHTGDPCIYGAIQEQMAFFDQHGMDYHITPGISSFLAAAAELRSQFTIPERCQTIILTRGEGRTPVPEKEKLSMLASHQSTMCIFLSASIVEQVQEQLLQGGYPPDTPVAACYKLTWSDQRIYRGQLKDLSKILKENNLTLTTMIVVGEAIDNRKGLSKLYDGHFTHLFRKGKE